MNTSMQATGTKYFIIILLQFNRVSVKYLDLKAINVLKVFLVDCKSGALSQVVLVLVVSARVK